LSSSISISISFHLNFICALQNNKKMLTVVLLAGLIGLSACDVSSGPYPYSPSPASAALPGEYGAPPLPNSQYGAPASPSSVQLSQENIQFGGQIVEVNKGRPNNVYLPPSSSSQFQQLKKPKTQNNAAFLPKPDSPKPFRAQLNAGEVFVIPRQSAQFRNPIFVESQSVFSSQQQLPQYQQIRQFNSAAPQFQRQQVNTVYGPPATQGPYPYPPSPPVHETSDERTAEKPFGTDEAESEETTDPTTVIAVSNASTGQYYILGKDNSLQRVVYEAIQTEDDAVNNGFTAQLRYSPVEPIRDPVYGYDDEGHLVRIFNKK